MKLTDEQLAVVSAISSGQGNYAVNAVAGGSKTTVLVEGAKVTHGPRILYIVFNTRNKKEAETKMPPHCTVKTSHGLGYAAARKALGKKTNVLSRWGGNEKTYQNMESTGCPQNIPDMARLIGLLKNSGYNVEQGAGPIVELLEDFVLDIGTHPAENVAEYAIKILKLSAVQCYQGTFDFNDMLWFPMLYTAVWEAYDLILVDEAQDLSPLQHQMVQALVARSNGRVIIVGDPFQAIYAFRGAHSRSFDLMTDLFHCQMLPLSFSFRCSKAVVKEAQFRVPYMKPWDQAEEGQVTSPKPWILDEVDFGSAILCRNTKPLIPIYYSLLRLGKGAKILGADIGKGILNLLKKGKDGEIADWDGIQAWVQAKKVEYEFKGDEGKAEILTDKFDILKGVADRIKSSYIRDIEQEMSRMFSDERGPVTLSTVHKAKGMEWKYVYFLDTWLIPSRWATDSDSKEQEWNIKYVGITRSQRDLIYVNSHDAQ